MGRECRRGSQEKGKAGERCQKGGGRGGSWAEDAGGEARKKEGIRAGEGKNSLPDMHTMELNCEVGKIVANSISAGSGGRGEFLQQFLQMFPDTSPLVPSVKQSAESVVINDFYAQTGT